MLQHHSPTDGSSGAWSASGAPWTGAGDGAAPGWVDLLDTAWSPFPDEAGYGNATAIAAAEANMLVAPPAPTLASPGATGALTVLTDPAVLTGLAGMPLFQTQAGSGDPVSSIVDQVVQGTGATSTYGVTGAGIKIGIISDSFNTLGGAAADEADGALPAASMVHILQDYSSQATDEGRAMAQIVHSIAPGAQIYFYTCGNTDASMATAITALQNAGCNMIVDDVSFFDEPFYQEGDTISNAINAAVASGVTYFTAATNASNSYYEGNFSTFTTTVNGRSATAQNFAVPGGTATAYEEVTIPKGLETIINLQWAQPFATSQGIATGPGSAYSVSLDLFNSNKVFVGSLSTNEVGKDPTQLGEYENTGASTTFYIALVVNGGTVVPGQQFKIIMENDSTEPVSFANGGTGTGDIVGHEADPNAVTVGAVPESNPGTIEDFSSYGPGEFLYGPNGTLLATPVDPDKVNLVAPDGNSTSFASNSGLDPFYGTSAAAPAAAAVAALVLQANAALNPSDIENLLTDTTTPESASANVAGSGLVDAMAAVGIAETLTFNENTTNLTLLGTHLNDTFVGGPGNHTINGEGGFDTLDYAGATTAVSVNFTTGTAVNGSGGTDSFSNIEAVEASASVNTTITGAAGQTVTVDLAGLNAGVTLALGGGAFILDLTQPSAIGGVLAGLAIGDVIDLAGTIATAAPIIGSTISITTSGGPLTYQLAAPLPGDAFTITGDGSGGSDLILSAATSYGLASAKINTASPVTFANVRQGTAESTALSITNSASPPAEGLDASIAGTNGAATASGTLSLLAAGATNTSSITVGLNTATAGAQSGTVTVGFGSDGSGTDGHGVTSLASQTVQVKGNVDREASGSVASLAPLVVHVGDTVSLALAVTNSAANDGFSENLIGTIAATSGGVSAGGTTGDIAAQATSSGSLTAGFSTGSAGTVSGSVTVGFASDGTGLDGAGPTSVGQQVVAVNATIDNYAVAAFEELSGGGTFSANGNSYTLSLGTLVTSAGSVAIDLGALNNVTGPADLLAGSFVTSGSSAFTLAGFGAFSGLAAGAADTSPTVTLSLGSAGSFSETITLNATGSNSSGYAAAVTSKTLTITASLQQSYGLAAAKINTASPVTFANVRQGTAESTALSITNSASPPAEGLDASIAGSSGAATASGTLSLLAAGATNTSAITVGLNTASAGAQSGTVTVGFGSDGSGTDGHGVTSLGSQTVQVKGNVDREASGSVASLAPLVVHVGDTVSLALAVTNSAANDGFSENLIGTIASTSGGVSAGGTTGDIAAQATSSGSLTAGFSTGSAGTVSGSVTVGFASDGTGLDGAGPTSVGQQVVAVNATIDNYAVAAFEELSGGGTFSANGNSYTLSLGTLVTSAGSVAIDLGALNNVTGPADLLAGSFVTSGSSAFTLAGFGAFSGLAAGAADTSPTVTLSLGSAGSFSETITLNATGSNSSGYAAAVASKTLTITASLQQSYGLASAKINTASPVTFANVRQGTAESTALSITNSASPPAEGLDASIAGTNGAATASGTLSLLAAGATNTNSITVGLNTATAGAESGTVTVGFGSDGSGTDGHGVTALASQTVQVKGNVDREASGSVASLAPLVVHVGDTVSLALAVTNSAANDGFSENLIGTIAATSGGVSAGGTTGDIAAQATSSGSLTAGFSTGSAGTVSGSVTVGFASDGTGLDGAGPTSVGQQVVAVNATIDNYAVAAFEELSGGGTFSANGNSYTLSLGTLVTSAGSVAIDLGALNNVTGPADLLAGSFVTSGSSAFTLAGFGAFSGLAAGAADTSPTVTLSLGSAGSFSETITLNATGSNSSGYAAAVTSKTLTITASLQQSYGLAAAKINTASPVTFANVRQGTAESTALSITNSASPPAEGLDASIAGSSGAATASGTLSLLAAGATNTSAITVGLNTASAGAQSGTVTVGFGSDGSGTDGHGVTSLGSQTVQVKGNVDREASGSVASLAPLVVHVGDTVSLALAVTNSAANDGFSENLIGTIASTSGGVSAGGTTGDIAAQATSSGSLTAGFSTGSAGTVSGSVTVGFASDGTGLDGAGPTSVGQQVVAVNATIDNYAVAAFEELSGGGTFSANGNSYTLSLGTLVTSAGSVAIDLGALNNVTGPADLLAGSFVTSGSSAFTLAGFGAFSGLAAGAADTSPTVTLSLGSAGSFSETITLNATGSNSSGYAAAVASKTLTITASLQQSYGLASAKINTASPVTFANVRQGTAESTALSITNSASPPAEGLDASIAGTNGAATASGTLSLLAAGATNTNSITVGLNTATAGAESGTVTVGFGSDGSGTDGHGVTALASQTVQVKGNVDREASGSVASLAPLVVHVGDTVSLALAVTNSAANDGFSENLIGTIASTSGGVSAGGTTGDIAAQATSSGSLTAGFSTGSAGTVSGSVTVGFASDGTGLDGAGPTSVGQQVVAVNATIDNYAVAAFEELSGGGTFSANGNSYTLSLGTLVTSAGSVAIDLGALNNVTGPADLLAGSFVTSGSSAFTLAGFGAFSGLAAGAADTSPTVTLSLGSAGSFSETITLNATGSNSSGYAAAVTSKTLTITASLQQSYGLAAAKINTASPVTFANVRQGTAESTALSITNSASPPAEGLDASIAGSSGAATASGTLSLLAAGATNTSAITVGLNTASAGAQSGTVTVGFGSDGSGTDGHGVTSLGSQTVQVKGNVDREASGSVASLAPLVVHVGDTVSLALAVTNSAANDGFSENLIGTIAATSGGVSAGGTTGDLAAQATSSGALTAGFSTGSAGTVSGSVTVGFASDGTGLDGAGPTSVGQQVVAVNATIDNYAVAAFEELSGGGTFSANGNSYTLSLGTLVTSAGSVTIDLGALNNVTGPADLLAGSFVTSGSSAFTLAGFGAFSGLAAGAADTAPTVTLSLGSAGSFSETITLNATGSNSSGYAAAVASKTLTITASVQTFPPIWQGPSSGNFSGGWDVAADWSTGAEPGAGDVAEILAAGSYTITSSLSTTTGGLDEAATGATLAITNGSQFTIGGGGTSTNAGTISVAAGATVAVQGGTVSNSGGTIAASGAGAAVALAGATVAGGSMSTAATGASGGVIEATSGLTSALSGVSLINGGLIEALAGSMLVLASTTVTGASSSGVIEANGGTVELAGASVSGTLMTSGGGSIVAVGAGNVLNGSGAVINANTLTVSDGASLSTQGTITNNGVIALAGTGDATDLVIAAATTLAGTGTITLSSGGGNAIVSAGTAVTLANNTETIAGVGTLGDNHLTLGNNLHGVIDANGPGGLAIQTASLLNVGLIEATASGALTVSGPVTNTGTIAASGGNVTVNGGVTGTGKATIAGATLDYGGSVAAGQTVTFAASSTGTLLLGLAQSFSGTVAGLASGDAIDLANFAFSGTPKIASVTGTGAANTSTTLTLSDGALTAKIALFNQTANQMPTSATGYTLTSDLNGANPGTLLTLAAHS